MTPLARRLPRELRHNLGKYVGIFLLMCASIALTSGFLLAAHSISVIIDGMRDEYSIEDGRMTTSFEATEAQLDAARAAADGVGGVDVYENFSVDARFRKAEGDDGTSRTLRTYAHRTEVDIAAYCEGRVPEADDEVAVDRVFATNNGLSVGDEVTLTGRTYTVVGIMTQPDSQALFADNSDFTVSTITYGVAEVSQAGLRALEDAGGAAAYTYSFSFRDRSLSVAERTDAEKDMVSALTKADARVDELIDADSNQGIGYAASDVTGDSAMWTVLLDIIIVIMAFVFVVLTNATIEDESAIIGTLLASGYRRREVVLHYLTLPAVVGVLASALGCVLGVTFFTTPMKDLYYGSYSLPPFQVSWDWGIFLKCAVAPAALLVLITLLGLLRKMGKTPLQFLRHEASGKSGTKRGFRLPERLDFAARFRIRVFLRNLGNFATLFVGIGFASLLLLFALAILPTMNHYADNLVNSLVAEHQYTLKAPVELEGTDDERVHPVNTTDNGAEKIAQAEKYAVYTLQYDRGEGNGEETVTVYGISPDSAYWKDVNVGDGRIVFGGGLIDKFGLSEGDTVSMYDKYEDETRKMEFAGDSCTWGSRSDMNLYMSLDDFNEFFGNDADYFNAYASDEELELDPLYFASETTPDDMRAIGDQFTGMMDKMIGMLLSLSVFIFLLFIYLLTKAVIDRSARSISYMKVFGYRDREISKLYIRSITICVVASLVLCLPLIIGSLTVIFKAMLISYSGNIEIYVPWTAMAQTVAAGLATYLAVAALHTRSIKRVSLSEALKVQE
ncbi:ABC transporter permease [Paratractidigestivibacter faecalis]|uniref:ABC transporter permease n=1 Tax=Paratractidigestivibacter faecalis TaxID=2292441 RepID=UPI003AB791DA